jgi:phosphonate transport system substrate-binding protein
MLVSIAAVALAACGSSGSGGDDASDGPLRIGAIPDQDPEQLARLHGSLAGYLSEELQTEVEYVPVTDYAAAVSLFAAGDLDLVWFGGLTGVQARLQTPDSVVVAQRDVDTRFQSVFIANADAGIEPFDAVEGLSVFAGSRFTFGSESSTSGRLMPQFFLDQAGVGPDAFDGEPGFSGSHDATIDLVESGSFEAGAVNLQVWERRVDEGSVDPSRVVEVFRTPEYHDYHWLARSSLAERYGDDFIDSIFDALTGLSASDAAQAEVLELFGAGAFVAADASDYADIESIGRELGLIAE